MCTVSLVPYGGALSVVCNRDERHARVPAEPPIARTFGTRQAILPIDPQGSGTWIATTDAGLAMALLNRRASAPASTRAASRGLIIPLLLASAGLDEAAARASGLDAAVFLPFTLLLADRHELVTLTSDGRSLSLSRRPLILPVMFTSSSLDEARAQRLRGRLFRRMVLSDRDPRAGQARFHAHQWPHHQDFSVVMWRADARTVSRTHIEVSESGTSLRYEAVLPQQ